MPRLKQSWVLGVVGKSVACGPFGCEPSSSTASARSRMATNDEWNLSHPSSPSDRSTSLSISQTR